MERGRYEHKSELVFVVSLMAAVPDVLLSHLDFTVANTLQSVGFMVRQTGIEGSPRTAQVYFITQNS